MDPQQRLLLEVAWEALEHAGLAARPASPAAGPACSSGSAPTTTPSCMHAAATAAIDAYTGTGQRAQRRRRAGCPTCSGCRGPSLAVDTACSSSLVAVHLACQSLRTGECDLALAGGVNLILLAASLPIRCRAGAHARARRAVQDVRRRRGRLSSGARAAAWWCSSGCRDARRDGDRILAVIRGSAVNHDGRERAG